MVSAMESPDGAGSASVSKGGRPTIADVARRAGVSKGLVSFALNDRPGVAPETRERILEAARELGWRPSLRARSLASADLRARPRHRPQPRRHRRRPVLPRLHRGHRGRVLDGGQVLVLAVATPGPRTSPPPIAASPPTSGSTGSSSPTCERGTSASRSLRELGLAAVTLGDPTATARSPPCRSTTAPASAPRSSTSCELGHRRIAHVAGPATCCTRARRTAAFDEAADAHAGLDAGSSSRPTSAPAGGRGATEALLSSAEPPDRHRLLERPHGPRRSGRRAARAASPSPTTCRSPASTTPRSADYLHPALTSVATDAARVGRGRRAHPPRRRSRARRPSTSASRPHPLGRAASTGARDRPNDAASAAHGKENIMRRRILIDRRARGRRPSP